MTPFSRRAVVVVVVVVVVDTTARRLLRFDSTNNRRAATLRRRPDDPTRGRATERDRARDGAGFGSLSAVAAPPSWHRPDDITLVASSTRRTRDSIVTSRPRDGMRCHSTNVRIEGVSQWDPLSWGPHAIVSRRERRRALRGRPLAARGSKRKEKKRKERKKKGKNDGDVAECTHAHDSDRVSFAPQAVHCGRECATRRGDGG